MREENISGMYELQCLKLICVYEVFTVAKPVIGRESSSKKYVYYWHRYCSEQLQVKTGKNAQRTSWPEKQGYDRTNNTVTTAIQRFDLCNSRLPIG